MKAVDTNVLVRLLTNDDPAQARIAADELQSGPVFVPSTVVVEAEWVLRFAYKFDRAQVGAALLGVVNLAGAVVGDEPAVRTALRWHAEGMDLADALHLALSSASAEFITFDQAMSKSAVKLDGGVPVRLLE